MTSHVFRILDANANRAREAMRVMEDAARFGLGHPSLSRELKQLRHDLAASLASLVDLPLYRDTPGDVGTRVTTTAEGQRADISVVVMAAGKRLSEALRSLEEFSKTLPGFSAEAIEQLRYRGYRLEQQLNVAFATSDAPQWRLCVLISEDLCRSEQNRNWLTVAQAAIAGGADCIQLREKHLDSGELLRRAAVLADLCKANKVSLIVNDRPDVALACGADGVHLGQTDLPVAVVRRMVGRSLIVGQSTSCLEEAREALAQGADYCGVGPMFETTTKRKKTIVGPAYLEAYLAQPRALPHLAIGGITPENLPTLVALGVMGIAVSSVVCGASEPGQMVARLLSCWSD